MIRTQIYLPEEMILQIKLEAKAKKVNMSQLIRDLLSKNLEKSKKGKRASLADMVGIFTTDSPTNSATNHNSIYEIV